MRSDSEIEETAENLFCVFEQFQNRLKYDEIEIIGTQIVILDQAKGRIAREICNDWIVKESL